MQQQHIEPLLTNEQATTNNVSNKLGMKRFQRMQSDQSIQSIQTQQPQTPTELAIKERVQAALYRDIQKHAKAIRLLNDTIETHPPVFDRTKLQSVCCHIQPTPWYSVGRTPGCIRSRVHMNCGLCQKNVRVCIVRDRNNVSPVYAEHGYWCRGNTFFSKEELLEAGCILELEGLCQLLHTHLGACLE